MDDIILKCKLTKITDEEMAEIFGGYDTGLEPMILYPKEIDKPTINYPVISGPMIVAEVG